ncbi:50S ribosomal protein L29 [Candidatus Uhrbacteria bacterium]|nr:50S ribosomal protein L29 [Candidatus Uhrbacteria bacterium]
MDIKELRQKNVEELRRMAQELRTEIQDLRFKAHLRSLRHVRSLRVARKTLARVIATLANLK